MKKGCRSSPFELTGREPGLNLHVHAAHSTHAVGDSAPMASVVSISEATEAAFCSAVRVTLVGSRMPISIMSPYWPFAAL